MLGNWLRGGERRTPALASAAAALAALAAFWPALEGGFVWDDELLLLANPHYRGLDPARLRWMFTDTLAGPYQPLAWLSYALDFLIGGMDPRVYRRSNVLLHAANAALFCLAARRLLAAALPRAGGARLSAAALAAALLFALHPLRVESVAWISERRDVLCGLFYLAAVLCYLRMAERAPEDAARARWRAAALAAFALALLAKATAMTLPAVLLVLDVYPLRRAREGWRRLLAEKLPFAALGAAFGAFAWLGQAAAGAMSYQAPGWHLRIGQAAYGLMFYPRKTLWPAGLSPLYEAPPDIASLAAPFAWSAAAALALTALLLALRRRWPAGLAAWAAYAATLAPVSGLLAFGMHLAADRYSYLACMGWALLGGGALAAAGSRQRSAALAAGLALLLAAWTTLTRRQIAVWRDELSLWTRAVEAQPRSSVSRNKLGRALEKAGRLEEALAQFQESAALRPDYANARFNLGGALARRGRLEEAAAELAEAIRLRPQDAPPHVNLGLALSRLGRHDEAIAVYRRGLALAPRDAEARNNLGAALAARGRRDEALEQLRLALELNPGSRSARFNLAALLAAAGRRAEAARELRSLLELYPGDARARAALAKLGR